jgi:hypothetical protein
LILDPVVTKQYLKQQELLPLPKITISSPFSWQAKFLHKEGSYYLDLHNMSDSDWSDLFMELTKDDMISHEIHLIKSSKLNQNHLNYVRTLLDNQFRLTSLIIIANYRYLLDASIKIELFRHLKENNFITKLELSFKMDSNVFNELINLLKNKNNIICLHLSHNSCINDEEAIMLTEVLKNNTVLRSLSLIETSIGDIRFQALLSSLANSLSQLIVDNSRINTKSLFSLLAFLKVHSIIKYVSLKTNGISISTEINLPELMEKILKITNTNHCILDLDINEKIKETIAKVTDGDINLRFGQ